MAKSNKSKAGTLFPVLLYYYNYIYMVQPILQFPDTIFRQTTSVRDCGASHHQLLNQHRTRRNCQVNDKYYSKTGGGHLVICQANPYISRNVAHRVSRKWVE